MKSNPIKVGGKLFRYDFDSSTVEYIDKATAEDIEFERELKEKYGNCGYNIDESGYMVLATVGLGVENWKNAEARKEYLTDWSDEWDEETRRLLDDFIKNELPYLKEETE